MPEFLEALGAREDLLDSDMFDLLLSFSEFEEFKDLMLAFRDEGSLGLGFGVDVRPAGVVFGVAEADSRPDMEVDLLLVDPLQGAGAEGAGAPFASCPLDNNGGQGTRAK